MPSAELDREKSVRDVAYHLSYLAEALAACDPSLFAEYVAWARALFAGLGFPEDVLAITIACTRDVLRDHLAPEHHATVDRYLDAGLSALDEAASTPPSYVQDDAPLGPLARRYIEALLAGDRAAASQMILEAADQGTPVREIYLHVFQPVQREIGRLWQTNQISVAQEHYCTAATQLIMSQLYPRIFATRRTGHRLVATCVGGELHEIGVRMVADFFEMEGWDTYYLGANTPTESVLSTVEERQPDVLGVSATITMHVSDVRALIDRVRASAVGNGLKILVGGYPFNTASDLWRRVGADGYAADAQQATSVAQRWVSEG
jgi:methanogenic corrinoid protein MtbC1